MSHAAISHLHYITLSTTFDIYDRRTSLIFAELLNFTHSRTLTSLRTNKLALSLLNLSTKHRWTLPLAALARRLSLLQPLLLTCFQINQLRRPVPYYRRTTVLLVTFTIAIHHFDLTSIHTWTDARASVFQTCSLCAFIALFIARFA
jgi:hypothetical protein